MKKNSKEVSRNKGLVVSVPGGLKWFIPRKTCKKGILIDPGTNNQEYIAGYFREYNAPR